MAPQGKRVLVPSVLLEDSQHLFEEAGVELIFALPEPLRRLGGSPERQAERDRLSEVGVRAALKSAHALCAIGPRGQLRVTAELLDAAPSLQVVFIPSSGTDAIDLAAATERGVAVVNAAGNNYSSVAEHTLGLMLSFTRMIALAARASGTDKGLPAVADAGERLSLLRGKTLGIVGLGYVGREVARICRTAFAMNVMAFDPYFDPTEAERQDVELADRLDAMLPACDFVSIHCPLTPETHHLFNWERLTVMKPTAFLVNTSRGGTVDTVAVVRALQERRLAGAGLDVTEPEPLPAGHPLLSLENVILTPHLAGVAPETIARAGEMSARGEAALARTTSSTTPRWRTAPARTNGMITSRM